MTISLTLFSGTIPPWSLAALDANFQQIEDALNNIVVTAAGTYEPPFLSGSIQVKGSDGGLAGFGDFQFGRLLPNASGIPCLGVLLGGAGQTQVVYLTDEQLPGQKGITVIREAGDVSSTAPGTNDGGDLLDFAGASVNGQGGVAKYQGGTSVAGRAGDAILHGGNSTTGITGDAVVIGGETGTTGGSCLLIMTQPPGASGFGSIRIIAGNGNFPAGPSVELMQILSNGEFYLTKSGTGAGLATQPLVSQGIGQPAKWATAYTGTKVINGDTYAWQSGILMTINGSIT
jgi:hypothetical protein